VIDLPQYKLFKLFKLDLVLNQLLEVVSILIFGDFDEADLLVRVIQNQVVK
jgi:hypothetical protein